ncbi:MAG: protein translocase subunit SecF [Firmicutes bacterium]|nr:protein translocase subunit SecF [Bacillota bacterium]
MEKKPSIVQKFYSDEFKIARKGKWYAIAPAVIILVGLIIVLVINFNLGLDFTGGRIITIRNLDNTNWNQYRNDVTAILNDSDVNRFTITRIGEGDIVDLSIEFQHVRGFSDEQMNELTTELLATLNTQFPGANVVNDGETSARASGEHLLRTFMAVMAALIGILIYMLFRFKFSSGVSALVGLFHDILVMLALTAIFRIQINAAYIAALITVIAYSLNNTLILFDRVRSIEKHNNNLLTIEEVVDKSIKETFVRTMNTTITTLVPIFVLVIFGVPLIREFAIPILFGLIAGTFSTIFVTTSLYVRFEKSKLAARKRKRQQANIKTSA